MDIVIDINPVVANLESRRWTQNLEQTASGAVCAHGAVMTCKGLIPGDARIIQAVMRQQGLTEVWNDRKGRTKSEVLEKLSQIEVTNHALAETFGPQWEAVVALIRRAAVLTPGEAERLEEARVAQLAWVARPAWCEWDTSHATAWTWAEWAATANSAARTAARDAMKAESWAEWRAAQDVAARGLARDSAQANSGDAVWALVMRDLIGQHGFTQEYYDFSTGPWATTIGRVHPDDADRLGGE